MPRPLPHEGENVVLVPGWDHNYNVYHVAEAKVVYESKFGTYTEYHGDEHLQEGDVVVTAKVAG